MNRQTWINILIASFFMVSFLMSQTPPQMPSGAAAPENSSSSGKRERNYTMNVSVNLVVLHPSWKNVGGGRIGWIEEPAGAKGLELLIGSDPARTPRKINRWGFIAEHVSGSSARLVGVMTQSDEQSIEQAKASVDKSGKEHIFKAIRSRLNGNESHSFTIPLHQTENYTYKDAALLLSKIPEEGGPSVRTLMIPDGADPGFLFSVRELIDESVEQYRTSRKLNGIKQRQYVYNASLFELSVVKSELVKKLVANGKEYRDLIKSEFEARNKTTKKTSSFSVTYGIDGQLSHIPVHITYKPRWWFQADLLLDENAKAVQTAQKAADK
jgi:hypothetical protein